jgi:cullin-associated NEDD8-dissociated protein 1
MWGILFEQCEIKEEGMRNVVADCLGKLTLIEPDTLLPQLQQRLASPDVCSKLGAIRSAGQCQ